MNSATDPAPARPPGAAPSETTTPEAKRAARAAFIGLFVDFFDIYLPIVALAPAMIYFQPEGTPKTTATTIFYLTFAVTLAARPLGSTIFGYFGDKYGRRRSTLVAIAGFTGATFAMALLPGYQQVGYAGIALLVACRFIGGIFMGGEYTGANSLALEAVPTRKRGIVGGVIGSAYPWGYVAISLLTLGLLQVLPAGAVDSAYVQWGWRIAFVAGGILGVLLFFYFRRTLESETWLRETGGASREHTPFRNLFTGLNRKVLIEIFVLMSGLWLITQATVSTIPGLLVSYLELDSETVTAGMLVVYVVMALSYLVVAQIGQMVGRRRTMIGLGAASIVAVAPLFYGMVGTLEANGSMVLAFTLITLLMAIGISPFALAHTYVIERFPTSVRASGYGIGYSTAIILPSFYSLYMLGLESFMPYAYTPIVLIVIGGALTIVGAAVGRDNDYVDMSRVDPATPTLAASAPAVAPAAAAPAAAASPHQERA
ncbi:MAG: MFS transporter [Micromonosporaceae bacterium]